MKIINTFPPNYEQILKHLTPMPGAVFTYGDDIYNPESLELERHVLIHEAIHAVQQEAMKPEEWWSKYFTDPFFRLEQEIPAYQAQYGFICTKVKDRNLRSNYLRMLALDLSGPAYDKMISYADAAKKLRG